MNGKFLYDIMLVNWLYGGIWTLLFLWWAITVEPVLKGTCIERPPVYKQYIPTKCMHVFLWLVPSQKRCDILSQKHLRCKKSKAKKVQVTEQLKGVKLLWSQEEKIYQQGCVELQHTKQVE